MRGGTSGKGKGIGDIPQFFIVYSRKKISMCLGYRKGTT